MTDEKPPVDATAKGALPTRAATAGKPYAAPTLICWGTLRDVTGKVGRSGKSDNGYSPYANKTRP